MAATVSFFRMLLWPIRHYSQDDVSVRHVFINCRRCIAGHFVHSDAILNEIDMEPSASKEQFENSKLPMENKT